MSTNIIHDRILKGWYERAEQLSYQASEALHSGNNKDGVINSIDGLLGAIEAHRISKSYHYEYYMMVTECIKEKLNNIKKVLTADI